VPVEEMMDCGVDGIDDAYMRMYSSYTGRRALNRCKNRNG
jgi:hypothetical protein